MYDYKLVPKIFSRDLNILISGVEKNLCVTGWPDEGWDRVNVSLLQEVALLCDWHAENTVIPSYFEEECLPYEVKLNTFC